MSKAFSAAVLCLTLLLHPADANAQELRVLASLGIKAVVEELAPRFEAETKQTVRTVFDLASTLKTKVEGGEPFDVVILTPPLLDDLITKGVVSPASRTVIARVGLGVMIRAGASKPDLRTVDAFSRTLLAAKSVAFAPAGASGVAFLATIEKLGIAAKVSKRPLATGDEVAAAVVGGDADLAILPVSEILPVRGAALAGEFPADVQTYVVMAAGVGARSTRAALARDFVAFLTAPRNAAVIQAKGMR